MATASGGENSSPTSTTAVSPVNSTARGAKLDLIREHFKANPNFEAVKIDDIATGDFSSALKGAITTCLPAAFATDRTLKRSSTIRRRQRCHPYGVASRWEGSSC